MLSRFTIYTLLSLCFIPIQAIAQQTQPTIYIQLNAGANSREAFLPLFKKFEKETGIKVIAIRFILDEQLRKEKIKEIPDISYTQNSERLKNLVKLNKVEKITDLWQSNKLDQQFHPEVKKWLSYQNDVYAVPYSQLTWGIFYNKKLIKTFGKPPQQWSSFIDYCVKVKQAGYDLFPISKKQKWLTVGWFEYFIIRMHGFDFYNQLIQGKVSYLSNEIKESLTLWQEMINKGLFTEQYTGFGVDDLTPLFLRGYINFIFMSNNLGYHIFDKSFLNNIEFMPFPKINDIPKVETAPVSVLFISKTSSNKQAAKKFLAFVTQKQHQKMISNRLFMAPPNIHIKSSSYKFTQSAIDNISAAQAITPFYDRAIPLLFEEGSTDAFSNFAFDGDIEKLTKTLEELRLKYY